jgi:hypothetical protein
MIYFDALPFDIPGEIITSYRAMNFGDESFEQYTLSRVAGKINFLSTILTENGKVMTGDERLFTKKYGAKILDYLKRDY